MPFLHYDELVHYGAYAGLAFLSLSAFERRRGIVVALSMILLGAAMEFLQHFSPGRSPDITDAIVNTLGVLSGISVGLLVTGALARDASPRRLPKSPILSITYGKLEPISSPRMLRYMWRRWRVSQPARLELRPICYRGAKRT